MKLSIITVNLNNREGLQRTIDSVVGQTFRDFEWIVIDGGSTDGSRELIEQYSDHFAYWVSEPDKGIYNAMNKGIKIAKGEYLQFLNSGDWLCDNSVLERCFSHEFDADIAYCNTFLYDDGEIEARTYPDHLTLRFLINDTLCHNSTLIKREILQPILYNETLKLTSDWEFFLLQLLKWRVFLHIKEFLVFYDMKGASSINGELVLKERDFVIKKHVPDALLTDYRQMEEQDSILNQDRVKKVISFSKKKKLYRKMINGCLHIIALIDRLSQTKAIWLP